MFGKRKKGNADSATEPAAPQETLDIAQEFGFTDDSDIASRFGEEAESAWDGMSDSPLTGAPGASLTPVPDDLLHSGRVESVRFQIASPKGYYFPQVEEFVRQVADALREWEALVHERDVYIHSLQHELELQRRDVRSLRTQIEIFRVQGDAVVNADGSYVTESQVSGVTPVPVPAATVNDEELLYFRERATSLEVAVAEKEAEIADLSYQLQVALNEAEALKNVPAAETPVEPAGIPSEYEENLAMWAAAVTERDQIITGLQEEVARLSQALAARPTPIQPAVPTQPLPPRPQPPARTEPPMVWTPTAAPAAPTQQPDPRLASPVQVSFEEESPLSVWAPDLINGPLDMSPDDDLRGNGTEFLDTSFRNRT